ncbi:MAG: hypothetical protein EOM67_16075 [Spirochaetia bacterium]|nr:hypothetical protein [Spirochaetia bacterium]
MIEIKFELDRYTLTKTYKLSEEEVDQLEKNMEDYRKSFSQEFATYFSGEIIKLDMLREECGLPSILNRNGEEL